MDELVEEFLVETKEGLDVLDNDLVALEQNPEDKAIVDNIFRAMHTIKGTCGFLGLGRLEKVAHAGENILDKLRDGVLTITPDIISAVLTAVDQIKYLVDYLEENEEEPEGEDQELIDKLNTFASGGVPAPAQAEPAPEAAPASSVANDPSSDSDELQRLFDATESLVEITPNAKDTSEQDADPGIAVSRPIGDSGDSQELQKLFDETESLVDIAPVADAAPEEVKDPEPEAKSAPSPEPKEEKKAPVKKTASANQSIRVNINVLEQLMQQASELVLTRNQLLQILRRKQDSEFTSALQQLNHITTGIQEGVMKTRMQPVGTAWSKLPRIVRDLANELGKKIELKMEGEDTELDRQLLEMIKDPLTHMVRNSADHGLEMPDQRREIGKPEVGTINLLAYQGGGYIIIEISDDGKGIDPEVIKAKAIEKGLVSEADAEGMSDNQILQFIFAAGFSTAAQVTSVSGRGVGMDVVKNNIEKISGTIDLQSTMDKGSTFTIKIPLTLAIMPVLEVATKNYTFAIPQINVMEIVKVSAKNGYEVDYINDRPVLRLRGKLLPLIALDEALSITEDAPDTEPIVASDMVSVNQSNMGELQQEKEESAKKRRKKRVKDGDKKANTEFIVVCEIGGYNFGVIVHEVYDTEEIVVKPVSRMLKGIELYSGSTILGNGDVIMILDPNGLARTAGEVNTTQRTDESEAAKEDEEDQISSFVVFKAGDETPKVVPLELLSRLEEIDVEKIEISRGQPVVQYRGNWMRICDINGEYTIPEDKKGIQEFLVFTDNDRVMGIAVEEVVDIVRCPMPKTLDSEKDGFLGSVVIDEKTCDVIDSSYHFSRTYNDEANRKKVPAFNPVGKRVLLIDDSAFFRKFIPPELEISGYFVQTASGAEEAIDIMEATLEFNAVVTDMNMPGMSGQDFADFCKKSQRYKEIPIIALSSHSGEDGRFAINEAGSVFSAFVSKTNHGDLIDTLATVLSVKESVA